MKPVLTFKESPDAWQTKVQVFLRLPFPLPWLLIAGVLFGIGCGVVALFEERLGGIRFLAVYAVLVAAIANAVVFFEKLLDEVADVFPELLEEENEKAKAWVRRWYRRIFWSKTNLYVGLGLAIICTGISLTASNQFFQSVAAKTYFYFIIFVIGFLGGSMLWTMLGVAALMSSLGKDVNIRPSIFDSSTSALRAAASVLWKVSLTAVLTYILGISPIFLFSIHPGAAYMIVICTFGIFVLLYFIIPQMNIHKTLVRLKGDRLRTLVAQIDNAFDKVTQGPTPENINQLRNLFDLQKAVNQF